MEATEIYTIEWFYFSEMYATEYHLRIQNVHLQLKTNRLLENKSSADIYWRHKGYRKETVRMMQKGEKNSKKKGKTY